MLRIFPGAFLFAPAVVALRHWREGKSLHSIRQFAIGGIFCGLVCLSIGCLAGRGPRSWIEFENNLAKHKGHLANQQRRSGCTHRLRHLDTSGGVDAMGPTRTGSDLERRDSEDLRNPRASRSIVHSHSVFSVGRSRLEELVQRIGKFWSDGRLCVGDDHFLLLDHVGGSHLETIRLDSSKPSRSECCRLLRPSSRDDHARNIRPNGLVLLGLFVVWSLRLATKKSIAEPVDSPG